MILAVYILIILICFIGLVFKPKNKLSIYIIIGLVVFLIGRGAVTYDTINYYSRYLVSGYASFQNAYEPGYLLLQKIGVFLGFDYTTFRLATTFIAITLIYKSVRRISFYKNSSVFLFFLFFCSFHIFIYTEQFRDFLAFSFVTYGLSLLLTSHSKNRVFHYLLYLSIATTIHISSLIYFPFILIAVKKRKIIAQLIATFSLLFSLVVFFGIVDIGFVKKIIIASTDGGERFDAYGENRVNLGFLYAFLPQLVTIFFLLIILNNINKESRLLIQNGFNTQHLINKQRLVQLVLLIDLISLTFFPLYMFNLQFIRLARNVFLINLMLLPSLFFKYKYVKFQKTLITLITFMILLFWFYYAFVVSDHIENIIIPFFQNMTVLN